MNRIIFLFALVVSLNLFSQEANRSIVLEKAFAKAYNEYPELPKGLLESMAYSASRMENLTPTQHDEEHHGPQRFGLFALVENGQGYFKNNLVNVCEYAQISKETFKQDEEQQILAVAKYLNHLKQTQNATNLDLKTYIPVLEQFMEIPLTKDAINTYARAVYIYDIAYYAQQGFETPNCRLMPIPLDMANIFDAQTLAKLKNPKLTIDATQKNSERGLCPCFVDSKS